AAHPRQPLHPTRDEEETDADQRRALVRPVSRTRLAHTAGYALALVALTNAISLLDRNILAILAPRIKHDLGIGDAEMGLLYGTVFALFYALFALPLGRLADGWVRTRLLAITLAFWSLATALAAAARAEGLAVRVSRGRASRLHPRGAPVAHARAAARATRWHRVTAGSAAVSCKFRTARRGDSRHQLVRAREPSGGRTVLEPEPR